MAWSVVASTISEKHCGLHSVCQLACALSTGWRVAHSHERITTARVDRDATREVKFGAAGVAVEEAKRVGAAAGDCGGRPGGDIDTTDAVVAMVLRSWENTLRKK